MIGKERAYTSINTTPDAYEPDDNYWLANWIPTNGTKQLHDFHVPGDPDYVKFNATEDERYLIETSDLDMKLIRICVFMTLTGLQR